VLWSPAVISASCSVGPDLCGQSGIVHCGQYSQLFSAPSSQPARGTSGVVYSPRRDITTVIYYTGMWMGQLQRSPISRQYVSAFGRRSARHSWPGHRNACTTV